MAFSLELAHTTEDLMKDEKLDKAARYLRTSAQNDEEASESLDAQEEYCLQYAAESGFDVDSAHVYREIGDGSGPDRPELERLLDSGGGRPDQGCDRVSDAPAVQRPCRAAEPASEVEPGGSRRFGRLPAKK